MAAVSPSFKQNLEWEKDIRDRVIFVNQILEPLLNIHFAISHYLEWSPQDELRETDLLIEELRALAPLRPNEIVIGFHKMTQPFTQEKVDDMDVVGTAQAFRGYIIIRDPFTSLGDAREEIVLAHEVAHLFGGIHVSDARAMMAPSLPLEPVADLDPENREILTWTRDVDFREGLDSLSEEVILGLIAIYERKIRDNPHGDFYYQLGKFYQHLNQPAKAVAIWEEAIRFQYEDPYIHHELGFHYYDSGRYELAIRELGAAIAHLILPSQQREKANALNFLGVAYYQRGNLEQAIFSWLRALSADPDEPRIQGNLAVAYLESNDLDRGITELEKLAAKNPDDVTTLSNLGAAYSRAKKFEKAVEYFQKALEKKSLGEGTKVPKFLNGKLAALMDEIPESAIRLNLGLSYFELKRYPDARAELLKSKEQDAKSYEVHRSLAQVYLGMKDYPAAIRAVEEAMHYKKDDPYLYSFLGEAYAMTDQRDKAIEAVQNGLRYVPSGPLAASFYKNMGILYAGGGRYAEAVDALRKALNIEWKDAETHTHLGWVYLQSGNPKEAQRSLKAALAIDPNREQAKQMLQAISDQKSVV